MEIIKEKIEAIGYQILESNKNKEQSSCHN